MDATDHCRHLYPACRAEEPGGCERDALRAGCRRRFGNGQKQPIGCDRPLTTYHDSRIFANILIFQCLLVSLMVSISLDGGGEMGSRRAGRRRLLLIRSMVPLACQWMAEA
jgi:hypothetical protein